MPGPFATRGATPINAKQDMKYVPIFIGKFFTGLYTNRNPLNEGAVTDIYSKFYQANRNDSIIDGLNTELSPRMTLIRRYGSSPYNSNTFNPINSFQNFFPFQTGVGESIYVLADTSKDARVINNGQNSVLYTKSLGNTTSTSIQIAGSGTNDGRAGAIAWTNPSNITSSSSYANVSVNNSTGTNPGSQNLLAEAFSFAVSGTLVNIQVNFQYFYTSSLSGLHGSGNGQASVQLLRAGTPYGTPQIISLPLGSAGTSSVPITASLSFPIAGLTYTDVNNAAFGFEISVFAFNQSSTSMSVRKGQNSVSYQNVISLPGGKMRSQQLLNTLYMVDGVNAKEWAWFPAWQANFLYTQLQSSPDPDNTILDSNNNIEVSVGYAVSVTSTSASSGTLTVNYTGSAIVTIGDTWTFVDLGNATGLNFQNVVVLGTGASSFTAATTLSDYTTLTETNGLAFKNGTAGASGVTAPTFGTAVGSTTLDNTIGWINKGNAVLPMGITGPQVAPSTSLTEYTPINPATGLPYDSWTANTFYWRNVPVIVQSGNVWQLTQAGTTANSVPGFGGGVGTVQNDNTAQWTNQGSATRAVSTVYALNRAIQVNTSVTVFLQHGGYQTHYYSSLMIATTAGTSSSVPTAAISWNTAGGASNQDGTVVWTVISTIVQTSSYSNAILDRASATGATAVGNNQIVSLVTQIDDLSSGGGGYLQSVSSRWGVSQSAAPTWIDSTGSSTVEVGGLGWICGGPLSADNTGAYSYAFSYINSVTGDESTASPLSLPILLTSGNQVVIVGPTTTQPGIDTIGVYRTTQGPTASTTGGTPFFLTEIPMPNSTSWQYFDGTPDPGNTGSILDVLITASGYVFSGDVVTNLNNPPPVGLTNLTLHCGYLWGIVGNLVYVNTGPDVTVGNGGPAWSPENFYEFPGTAARLISTNFNGSTLFVFTSAGMYSIPGQGTVSNPFGQQLTVAPNISVLSYDAFAQDGSTFYVYTSDRNLLMMDVNMGFSDSGEPIADVIYPFDPSEVQLAFFVNNTDRALYLSDFQTGWYRLSAVAAPESGFLWSPKASIIGGISAIGSVTTSVGNNSLLIGPEVSGPILQRDRSIFSDNGQKYTAFATIGNIVLSHPGTMATVRFIAIDALKTGNKPTIGFLADEFLGYPTTPPFSILTASSNDPPKLNASKTLYALRYWLFQNNDPFWCRHALFKFDFGTNDTADELFSYTVYGGNLVE